MDQETLVESQINDGARVVEKLREIGVHVAAAWWMKPSEEGLWYLYIASKAVDEQGIKGVYHAIHTAIGSLGPIWVDRFRVRAVGLESPVTKNVLDILARYPAHIVTRADEIRLGNVSIDGSYIYPLPVAA